MVHKYVAITLDTTHAYECGLEGQSGKEDTPQLTIAVLMVRRANGPSWDQIRDLVGRIRPWGQEWVRAELRYVYVHD